MKRSACCASRAPPHARILLSSTPEEPRVSTPTYQDVSCPNCGRRESLRPEQMAAKLRTVGLLRRADDPEPDLVAELFSAALARLRCEHCGNLGLALAEPEELAADDWGDPVPCERCGHPIPPERLELFPDSKLCVACQQKAEQGAAGGQVEYCPHCGDILQLRKSGGSGITRYTMFCPSCRR